MITIKLDIAQIKKTVKSILEVLAYSDFDLGIWFTSEKTMRQYNKTYRNKDAVTDILSFAFHPDLKGGERIKPKTEDDKNLGDLIICPAYVVRTAQQTNIPCENHLRILLVHGICHLLGYDHEKDEDYRIMHRKEQSILKKIS